MKRLIKKILAPLVKQLVQEELEVKSSDVAKVLTNTLRNTLIDTDDGSSLSQRISEQA